MSVRGVLSALSSRGSKRSWTRDEVATAERAAWDAALRYAATIADRQATLPPHRDLFDAGWADACGVVAALLRQEVAHPGDVRSLRDAREAQP